MRKIYSAIIVVSIFVAFFGVNIKKSLSYPKYKVQLPSEAKIKHKSRKLRTKNK